MNEEEYWKFPGDIKISQFCLESNPCQHHVITGEFNGRMFGDKIYKLLQKKNIKSDHFERYSTQNQLKRDFKRMRHWKVDDIQIGQYYL